jgi:hypothetical protein
MIILSPTVTAIINSNLMTFFYLVTLKNDMRFTSAPFDITMQDGHTYFADSGLIGVEPPRASSVVDRATYKIAFADPSQSFKDYFESGATGDDVIVRLGFFNTLGYATDSTAPGAFFRQLENTIIVYKGVVDSQTFNIDFGQGEITATIECSSPMADLDLIRSFFTNKDSMRTRNPNDTAFDQVFDDASEVQYKWGKD